MNMKTIKTTIKHWVAVLTLALAFAGCAKFTDITPKGESLLDNVDDLELLLNSQGRFGAFAMARDPMYLVNDLLPRNTDILAIINDHENGKPSALSILITWDESADRNNVLNMGYGMYDSYYSVIGSVANPILYKVDNAIGDKQKAAQIKAEALVLRAYMHYLVVNLYAKAYNPATATTDGGVPYVFEKDIFETDIRNNPPKKRTVKEVYDFMIDDLNAALALVDNLPANPLRIRVGKAFAYAVKAKALMAVRDYEGAYQAATKSLEVNDQMLDHRTSGDFFIRREFNVEDLFAIFTTFTGLVYTPDLLKSFAPNDMLYNYGEMEKNLPEPYRYNTAEGLTVSRILGATAWMHYWMAAPRSQYIPNIIGLSTTDMWLTQAECLIRDGNTGPAMTILEQIRERRTIEGQTDPLPADPIEALKLVTRHEKFPTYQNYINLKRWNTEPEWETTLIRNWELSKDGFTASIDSLGILPQPQGEIVTKTYTLRPNSPLWIFPFPDQATNFNPNLTQNY